MQESLNTKTEIIFIFWTRPKKYFDRKYLKHYQGKNQTSFVWKINLMLKPIPFWNNTLHIQPSQVNL